LGAYAVFGNHDYRHYAMGEALPRMWRTFRQLDAARFESHGLPAWYSAATRWPRYLWYVRNTPLDGRRNGFNDCDQLATVLCAAGTTVLHNRAVHLTEPDGALDLYVAGIDDLGEGQPELGQALRGAPESALVLLLSHNPDIIAHPAAAQVDVVLAGHTHGGQLVLPFWGPAHTQSAHLSRRHVAGYFRQGQTHVYISRGLGEGIPLRFGARPQLALITLKAA
jgi:predicted MPP superfamily phosphohydrolase